MRNEPADDIIPFGRRAAVRSIFALIAMLSGPMALAHSAQARNYAAIQPGHGYVQAPIGHRQPTRDDVTGAGPTQFDRKNIEKDNELLERPSTQDPVAGADQIQSEESAVAKMIELENERIDRLIRGICRGC